MPLAPQRVTLSHPLTLGLIRVMYNTRVTSRVWLLKLKKLLSGTYVPLLVANLASGPPPLAGLSQARSIDTI